MAGVTLEELEVLYRGESPRYVRAAAAITGSEQDGSDAVQEAFIQAIKNRRSFRAEAPLEAWVWRIVINQALAARRGRKPEPDPGDQSHEQPSDELPDQDAAVRRWLAALPERQRLVVFLRYFADLDYRGIAAALEIEVGTVSATLAAAHEALRRSFQEVPR
jgi:RNA polymerase sigma-70 factor (ECF subfamily)